MRFLQRALKKTFSDAAPVQVYTDIDLHELITKGLIFMLLNRWTFLGFSLLFWSFALFLAISIFALIMVDRYSAENKLLRSYNALEGSWYSVYLQDCDCTPPETRKLIFNQADEKNDYKVVLNENWIDGKDMLKEEGDIIYLFLHSGKMMKVDWINDNRIAVSWQGDKITYAR